MSRNYHEPYTEDHPGATRTHARQPCPFCSCSDSRDYTRELQREAAATQETHANVIGVEAARDVSALRRAHRWHATTTAGKNPATLAASAREALKLCRAGACTHRPPIAR